MTINLDLMELADITQPKRIVNEIINQNSGITLPIPLEEIASAAGISDIYYKSMDGLEGALVANEEKTKGKIIINDKTIPSKRRFTLGHELGHFLIPTHGHNMKCTLKDLAKRKYERTKVIDIEAEANSFSSHLLMPPQLIKSSNLLHREPSIQNIIELQEACNVSFQASANNYINIHGNYLAIVYSKDKIINYGLNGNDNPLWLNADKGTQVPIHSLTHKADLHKTYSRIADEVDSSVWFDENVKYDIPEILIEETYVQENGYVATLLWFDESIEKVE